MLVTQKCQYALRALFALASRGGDRPIKIAQIAEDQQIPVRFLEVILSQLKQGGFVDSRRGMEGGYWLARPVDQIHVGELIRFVDGPLHSAEPRSPGRPDVFDMLYRQAADAAHDVLDGTTLRDLLDRRQALDAQYSSNYTI